MVEQPAAELAFDRDLDIDYGRPDRVGRLVRRIVCPNPGPFTFKGTATYIVGDREVAVIDPGPRLESHFEAIMTATNGENISHILVTHTHGDHSALAPRLKSETGAPVYAFGPHGAGQATIGTAELDAAADLAFMPDVRLGDGDTVAGRDWTLVAVHTPGHTSNHLALALPEEKALFSGDHVMSWSTTVVAPPDGNMGAYMASLRRLLDRDDDVYWPGHGPPRRDPRPFVRALLAHRQMRENAILERIRRGDRTVGEVVAAVYAGLDPRLQGAAGLSALAHIEHLIQQGKVVADRAPSLAARYRPA